MPAPAIYSLLLGSPDAEALRRWYQEVLGAQRDPDGFLHFGPVAVLIDQRDDVAGTAAEPGRVILNYTVPDIAAAARVLDAAGVRWIAPVEYREQGGAWFGTVCDPDGNYVQLIQLTPEYWRQRRVRFAAAPLERAMLRDATIGVRLPAQDLERARAFYADRLGLEPVEFRDGAMRYECGGDSFAVFLSAGRPSGEHTQLGFYVADIEAAIEELRARGLVFDQVDLAELPSRDGIVDIPGQYPSTGAIGERAIWFHDSEGNQLGLGQLVMPETR